MRNELIRCLALFTLAAGAACGEASVPDDAAGLDGDEVRVACPSDGNPCTAERRIHRACASFSEPDGTPCPGGSCVAGACFAAPSTPDAGAPADSGSAPAPGAIVSISAANASVAFGATPPKTVQLVATVVASGAVDTSVSWALDPTSDGCGFLGASVTASGLFSAPTSLQTFIGGTCKVIATANADRSKTAVSTVTITAPTEPPPTDPPPTEPPPTDPPPTSGLVRFVAHNGSDSNAGTIDAPWRTLSFAMNQLRPGYTLYIRGSTSPDANLACAGNGAQGGACWTETESCRGTVCSPLHWTGGDTHLAGTAGAPVTVAAYPGETVIIEPASGTSVVQLEPRTGSGAAAGQVGNAHCSHVVLDGLILDGRRVTSQVVWILPASSTITDPVSSMCSYGAIKNSKIRHGGSTGGIQSYTFHWDFLNNDIYENGSNGTEPDRDHAIYTQGQYNRIVGGRIHHNLQGIQTEAVGRVEPGYLLVDGVEIDHNGSNPWNGVQRNGSAGQILLLENQGKNATVRSCRIHDNAQNGISIGAGWSGTLVTGVTVSGNYLWNNANQTDAGGCGPSIYVKSGSSPACSANAATAP